MNPKNLPILIFSLIFMTHSAIIASTSQPLVLTSLPAQSTINTYAYKNKFELDNLKKNVDFMNMVARVKKFWENSMSELLGDVTAVQEQAINGVNRRVTFEVKNGFSTKNVLITVNLQPWGSVMKVINTVPAIPGGIADSDLSKIVLPVSNTTVSAGVSSSSTIVSPTVNIVPSNDILVAESPAKGTVSSSVSSSSLRSGPVVVESKTTTSLGSASIVNSSSKI